MRSGRELPVEVYSNNPPGAQEENSEYSFPGVISFLQNKCLQSKLKKKKYQIAISESKVRLHYMTLKYEEKVHRCEELEERVRKLERLCESLKNKESGPGAEEFVVVPEVSDENHVYKSKSPIFSQKFFSQLSHIRESLKTYSQEIDKDFSCISSISLLELFGKYSPNFVEPGKFEPKADHPGLKENPNYFELPPDYSNASTYVKPDESTDIQKVLSETIQKEDSYYAPLYRDEQKAKKLSELTQESNTLVTGRIRRSRGREVGPKVLTTFNEIKDVVQKNVADNVPKDSEISLNSLYGLSDLDSLSNEIKKSSEGSSEVEETVIDPQGEPPRRYHGRDRSITFYESTEPKAKYQTHPSKLCLACWDHFASDGKFENFIAANSTDFSCNLPATLYDMSLAADSFTIEFRDVLNITPLKNQKSCLIYNKNTIYVIDCSAEKDFYPENDPRVITEIIRTENEIVHVDAFPTGPKGGFIVITPKKGEKPSLCGFDFEDGNKLQSMDFEINTSETVMVLFHPTEMTSLFIIDSQAVKYYNLEASGPEDIIPNTSNFVPETYFTIGCTTSDPKPALFVATNKGDVVMINTTNKNVVNSFSFKHPIHHIVIDPQFKAIVIASKNSIYAYFDSEYCCVQYDSEKNAELLENDPNPDYKIIGIAYIKSTNTYLVYRKDKHLCSFSIDASTNFY